MMSLTEGGCFSCKISARGSRLVRRVATSCPRVLPLVVCLCACTSIPEGRSAVDDVTILNTHQVDDDDVTAKLATQATSKFLYLFRGILYDYELYDPSVVQHDLARVERVYRSRGFYDAQARVGSQVMTRHLLALTDRNRVDIDLQHLRLRP